MDRETLSSVYKEGGMFFAITVAVSSGYLFDNFLALQWLGASASAQITVALRICTTVAGILAVLTQPLWPAFVDAVAAHDRGWALRTVAAGSAGVAAAAMAAALLIVGIGKDLLHWWLRPDIDVSSQLLWASAAWIVVLCVPRVVALLFNALSSLRFQFLAAAAATLAAFVLKYSLADRFGAAGILGATPISWALIVWPSYAWKVSRGLWRPSPRAAAGRA